MSKVAAAAFLLVTALVLGSAAPSFSAATGPFGGPTYVPYDPPANAFDGNEATYWQGSYNTDDSAASTPFTATTWDLGYSYTSPQTVTRVEVDYAVDYRFIGTNAQVQCSLDGATWSTIGTLPAGQDPAVNLNAECQSVQVVMGAPGTGYSPAVWEVKIAATPYAGPPPPLPNPSTAASYATLGDSITAGSYAPISYTSLLPVFREGPVYTNKGVSGNSTENMLARMPDVLATGAQAVILMGGTNDCEFGWPTTRSMTAIDSIVQQAEAADRTVVLVGPIPRNETTDAGIPYTPCLLALRAAMSAYATAHSLTFVDPWSAFENPAGSGVLNGALTEDGIHPNARGAFVLARVIATTLGWQFTGD